jgi:2-polyprenyl-6-methoxyphenol hydroxylase-like FAD-dependent oxidoreductase
MRNHAEVVIVGAGVAGGALAVTLARDGVSVLLLEKTRPHVDRVQGEWLAPWGVAQAVKLGVVDDLIAAGGHYIHWTVPYTEGVPLDKANTNTTDLSTLFRDVPGALGVGYPRMCNGLIEAAKIAGATILQRVAGVEVEAGASPAVTFNHEGRRHKLRPKLVIGADGRGSTIAKQVGLSTEIVPSNLSLAGLLVEGAFGWPEDCQLVGTERDRTFFVFPQGNGQIRLYLCYPRSQRKRFAGPDAAAAFLRAFDLTIPQDYNLTTAKPAGPCREYPCTEAWMDVPSVPGVILIGDAAGNSDPSIGQGLGNALTDVLMIKSALLHAPDGRSGAFSGYIEDRRERMRGLRCLGRLISAFRCNDSLTAARRRVEEVHRRVPGGHTLHDLTLAQLKGPYETPADAFTREA